MAELQIAPARSSSSAPAVVVATLVLAVAAVVIFYFNPHKIADLKITGVDVYAPRTTFSALDGPSANGMHVLGGPTTSSEDNLYVIANLSLRDHLRRPLIVTGATARVTLADGTQLEASLLSASDLKRLEVIFPDIRQHAVAPISDGDQIESGQTRVGTLVLPFPGQTADAWRSKRSASLTVELRNQTPQTTAIP